MERHRDAPLSVSALARAVNLSSSYLTKLFRAHVGQSPAQYDKTIRLERARELVLSSSLSVKEIMVKVGWRDPSHFSREFKRRHGVAPSRLRSTERDLELTSVG